MTFETDPTLSPGEAMQFACVAAAWHRHQAELRRWLRRQLQDAAAVDDLLQDVFVKAMGQGRGFCTLDNPRAWLFQVARHALVDRARAQRPHDALDEDQLPPADPEAGAPDPVDALGDCVTRTLPELAPTDADILRACDLQGMTQREFAQAHGLTLAAAKARLLRARQRLRERITVACRVHFDEQTGRVNGHGGRIELATRTDGST